MRFEIAVHAQRGRVRSDLSQQPALDENPQIVVDRGERNGWNATPDRGINVFRGIVSVGSDDGLIQHLTLVRDRQTALRGQLTELFMGGAHDYRMRMIIKRLGAVSTEIFPVISKRAGAVAVSHHASASKRLQCHAEWLARRNLAKARAVGRQTVATIWDSSAPSATMSFSKLREQPVCLFSVF